LTFISGLQSRPTGEAALPNIDGEDEGGAAADDGDPIVIQVPVFFALYLFRDRLA
jgi:hypothetical protein